MLILKEKAISVIEELRYIFNHLKYGNMMFDLVTAMYLVPVAAVDK